MLPFQCDVCWFLNLRGRAPRNNCLEDDSLRIHIRRANLDAMWAKEPGTVRSVLGQEKKARELLLELGLEDPNYPTRGPWPVGDPLGMTTCLVILQASKRKGRHQSQYQQFDTIRKLRGVYTNLYQSSPVAEGHSLVFAGEKGRKYRTAHGDTESLFFKLFVMGLEKRMDKEVRSNIGLEFEILMQLLKNLEEDCRLPVVSRERRRFLAVFGAYLVIGYGGSLRGNEGFFVEAKRLIQDIHVGIVDPAHPHVCVPLYGRFKNEANEATSLLLLANESKHGLPMRRWVERLAGVLLLEGALKREGSHVPAICEADGTLMESSKINSEFLDQLERIQRELPMLIGDKVKVRQRYGISRSLRRGSRTRAQKMRVEKDIVELINRWSRYESVRGRPSLTMFEHYAEMKQLLDIFVIYSESL